MLQSLESVSHFRSSIESAPIKTDLSKTEDTKCSHNSEKSDTTAARELNMEFKIKDEKRKAARVAKRREKRLQKKLSGRVPVKPGWAKRWFLKNYEQAPNGNSCVYERELFDLFLNHCNLEYVDENIKEENYQIFIEQVHWAIHANPKRFSAVETGCHIGQKRFTNLRLKENSVTISRSKIQSQNGVAQTWFLKNYEQSPDPNMYVY